MKPSFQIWLRAALALLLAFAGLFGEPVHTARAYALNPPATEGSTITYDDEGNVAYDSSHRFPFGYDGGVKPPENKYGHQLSGYRAPFGIFSDFLAAEETVGEAASGGGRVFYGTPQGQLIEGPAGYAPVTAQNGQGLVLLPEGQTLGNNASIIRWGEPTAQNPSGYFRYYNGQGQPLNPATGLRGPNSVTHISPGYQGPLIGYPGR